MQLGVEGCVTWMGAFGRFFFFSHRNFDSGTAFEHGALTARMLDLNVIIGCHHTLAS